MTTFSALDPRTGKRIRSAAESHLAADGERGSIPVTAPFTGERIGTVPAGTPTDVEAAVERAREAQASWADRPLAERAGVLLDFHDLVLAERDRLLDLVQREGGKARIDALEEVLDVAVNARYYGHEADRLLGVERRAGALPVVTRTTKHHHPVGVVGVISPWNYPLTLAVSDALPALLAGNAVVAKPAEGTPFTALAVADLLADAGVPPEVFQVVTGDGDAVGPPLVDGVDYVTFTGSSDVGRSVAERAGRSLTECSLELGGKNPMVVLGDADVDDAVQGAIRGSFANAGQLCIAMERIYVHESVYDAFLDRFVERAGNLELGASLDYEPDVGSLASADQLEKVSDHVEDASEKGSTVRTGGRHRPDVGPYFYEPTVLTDLPGDARAATQETFGPVVSVTPVADAEEAITRANDSEYGLNASVFTGDPDRGVEVATRLECGTVSVNDGYVAAWASVDAPMGGTKASGIGRRHGPEGIHRYTEAQTVAVQRGPSMSKPAWLPGGVYERAMVVVLGVLERVRRLR